MVRHKATNSPVGQDWHKIDIKAALEKAGWSLRSLAKHHNVAHTTLVQALRSSYPASERRIAEALGIHPKRIWPSRYNKDGTPNGQRGNPNWIAGRAERRNPSTGTGVAHAKTTRAG